MGTIRKFTLNSFETLFICEIVWGGKIEKEKGRCLFLGADETTLPIKSREFQEFFTIIPGIPIWDLLSNITRDAMEKGMIMQPYRDEVEVFLVIGCTCHLSALPPIPNI